MSGVSVIANKSVCPHCSAMQDIHIARPLYGCCNSCGCVYSIDKDKKTVKEFVKKAPFQPNSVIDIGVTGNYKGFLFQVIGLARSINTDSISNEWLIRLTNGELLWLIENAFTYYIFDSKPIMVSAADLSKKKRGAQITVALKVFVITELSKQIEFQMDGQLPEDCVNTQSYFKHEAISPGDKELLSICVFDKNTIEAYRGNTVDLNQLSLSSMSKFKNWM